MSIHVWTCWCGRRWYRFGRREWDSATRTSYCPGCRPERAHHLADWSEL